MPIAVPMVEAHSGNIVSTAGRPGRESTLNVEWCLLTRQQSEHRSRHCLHQYLGQAQAILQFSAIPKINFNVFSKFGIENLTRCKLLISTKT